MIGDDDDKLDDALREEYEKRIFLEWLAGTKRPRGKPSTGNKSAIIRAVATAPKGMHLSEARALAAHEFKVSKRYVQRVTKHLSKKRT